MALLSGGEWGGAGPLGSGGRGWFGGGLVGLAPEFGQPGPGADDLAHDGREAGRLVLVLVLDRLGRRRPSLPAGLAPVGAAAGLLDRDSRAVGGGWRGTGDRDEQRG